MVKKFFKKTKRSLSFQEYMQELIVLATHIKEVAPGLQRYTSAQFEIALISFNDIDALKNEIDEDIKVEIPPLTLDWEAGFDWLDLAVSYGDKDAIAYFQEKMNDNYFANAYFKYVAQCRPECSLRPYGGEVSRHEL